MFTQWIINHMSNADRDIYWHRIKTAIGLWVGWFVLSLLVWTLRLAGNGQSARLELQTYPVAAGVTWVLIILTYTVPVSIIYFISKDKAALAREFDDVTERHWLTVGALSIFSYGIYPLWYFFARYRKVDTVSSTRSISRRFAALVATLFRTVFRGLSLVTRVVFQQTKRDSEETTTDNDRSDPETLRWRAMQKTTKGDRSYENGRYKDAVSRYEGVVKTLERAKQAADVGTEVATEIEDDLELVRAKLRQAQEYKTAIEAVRTPLGNAESSLQTAVVEHAQNERTPAHRDYRQAKDQYEQALTALDDSEYDVFAEFGDITVPIKLETEPLPSNLAGWRNISERELDSLSEAGIDTVASIRRAGETEILDLAEHEAIDDELAHRLRAVTWWHGKNERTFASRKAIERQRERADTGYQQLS